MSRVFSCDAVENMAHNQMAGAMHPFTCPNRNDGEHREAYGDTGALVATVRGWECPFCDYRQVTAHGWQTGGKVVNPMARVSASWDIMKSENASLLAENVRLHEEVKRLKAERDAAMVQLGELLAAFFELIGKKDEGEAA